MTAILLADNDPDFLKARRKFLEAEGYRVVPAPNPSEARRVLKRQDVQLAIIDIRLEDDDDDKDVSGLILAKDPDYRTIPKIILTGFPSVAAVREALGPVLDSLPPAVDFVAKDDGPEVMLRAVRAALELGSKWLRRTVDEIDQRLAGDYANARRHAQLIGLLSLAVAILGIAIIFRGTILALGDALEVGLASAICGIVTEAVGYLFYRRVDVANRRMDRYHAELLRTKRFENLLAACDEMLSMERSEKCKESIIDAARTYWFRAPAQPLQSEGTDSDTE